MSRNSFTTTRLYVDSASDTDLKIVSHQALAHHPHGGFRIDVEDGTLEIKTSFSRLQLVIEALKREFEKVLFLDDEPVNYQKGSAVEARSDISDEEDPDLLAAAAE